MKRYMTTGSFMILHTAADDRLAGNQAEGFFGRMEDAIQDGALQTEVIFKGHTEGCSEDQMQLFDDDMPEGA